MGEFTFTTKEGKVFEKPATGMYHGVLADIVDLGDVTTVYNNIPKTQQMCRFVWVLDVNGTDGTPLSITGRYGLNLHEKSNLYKTVKQILNAAPPLNLNPDSLVGQVRKLFIQQTEEKDASTGKVSVYANIIGISPADAGKTVPVPTGFVRDKNKPVAEQAKNKKKNAAPAQKAAPAQNQGADVKF